MIINYEQTVFKRPLSREEVVRPFYNCMEELELICESFGGVRTHENPEAAHTLHLIYVVGTPSGSMAQVDITATTRGTSLTTTVTSRPDSTPKDLIRRIAEHYSGYKRSRKNLTGTVGEEEAKKEKLLGER